MTFSQYAAVGLILFAGSILQGIVAFASGLLAVPLLLLVGVSLPAAVTISLAAAAVQNVAGWYRLRDHVDLQHVLRPVGIRLVMLPLGVYALDLVGQLGQQQVKQLVGVVLLAMVVVQGIWRVEAKRHVHWAWEWIAFVTSGFLVGFCGMGGPPMVLWVTAHDWPAAQSRAFQFVVIASGIVPQALLLYGFFGGEFVHALGIGAAATPVVLVGTALGLRMGHNLPRQRFKALALGIVALVALAAILSPLF